MNAIAGAYKSVRVLLADPAVHAVHISTANRQQISVAQRGQRQRGEVIDHPQLLYPQMRAQRYP